MRNHTDIDKIADEHTLALARLSPMTATYLGIAGHDHELDSLSPDQHDQVAALNRATLSKLDASGPADDIDQVTVAAMKDRLGLELELYEADEHLADLNVIASPLQAVRDVFDLMPQATSDDWQTIASRMSKVPVAIDGYLACLREGAVKRFVPAVRQVERGIAQARQLADPEGSFFVKMVTAARPDDSAPAGPLAAELERAAADAATSYGRLADALRDEIAPHAPQEDAVGRERYARFSRYFLGATVDLDETYQWGIEELARITDEQRQLAAQIAGPGATEADAIAVLNADSSRQLNGTDALREWMQVTADDAIARLDGVHFDIPQPVKTIECRIAPTQTGGIYYTGPSDDWSRPGRMWWSVPAGVEWFNTWSEKTTVYHEGVPGHHLQIGQAVFNAAELNMWRRLACWMSGHGEGWALYAERLMEEFGFMDDPGDRFGMLDAQRLRATRVVVDLGVHLGKPAFPEFGAGAWDSDSAWRMLRANVAMQEDFLRFELDRYLGWPGQAPSYKVGQRLWEQIRDAARLACQSRGEEFNLMEFHTRALNHGSIPMDVLHAEMTR